MRSPFLILSLVASLATSALAWSKEGTYSAPLKGRKGSLEKLTPRKITKFSAFTMKCKHTKENTQLFTVIPAHRTRCLPERTRTHVTDSQNPRLHWCQEWTGSNTRRHRQSLQEDQRPATPRQVQEKQRQRRIEEARVRALRPTGSRGCGLARSWSGAV